MRLIARALAGRKPAGYGPADRQMAKALARAPSKAKADQIARDNGLKDAKDAWDWLRERS